MYVYISSCLYRFRVPVPVVTEWLMHASDWVHRLYNDAQWSAGCKIYRMCLCVLCELLCDRSSTNVDARRNLVCLYVYRSGTLESFLTCDQSFKTIYSPSCVTFFQRHSTFLYFYTVFLLCILLRTVGRYLAVAITRNKTWKKSETEGETSSRIKHQRCIRRSRDHQEVFARWLIKVLLKYRYMLCM